MDRLLRMGWKVPPTHAGMAQPHSQPLPGLLVSATRTSALTIAAAATRPGNGRCAPPCGIVYGAVSWETDIYPKQGRQHDANLLSPPPSLAPAPTRRSLTPHVVADRVLQPLLALLVAVAHHQLADGVLQGVRWRGHWGGCTVAHVAHVAHTHTCGQYDTRTHTADIKQPLSRSSLHGLAPTLPNSWPVPPSISPPTSQESTPIPTPTPPRPP